MKEHLENPTTTTVEFSDDIDSCCSTPYVSAPSSPGRPTGFYYSAPTSPTHFIISTTHISAGDSNNNNNSSSFEFDFDFSSTFPSTGASSPESMTSADELFHNGQIRPMKLSTHLQRPQLLAPLIESDDDVVVEDDITRGRDPKKKLRAGSIRRRTRSMSPHRTIQWDDDDDNNNNETNITNTENPTASKSGEDNKGSDETTPCASRSSSRRWVFLKEFLYRSKSEGHHNKLWGSLPFTNVKDKKMPSGSSNNVGGKKKAVTVNKNGGGGNGKRSPHELHYTAKRAEAEEMRRKTYLPYRQGLFGCLGFSSKGFGAVNGFARALNSTVSSR